MHFSMVQPEPELQVNLKIIHSTGFLLVSLLGSVLLHSLSFVLSIPFSLFFSDFCMGNIKCVDVIFLGAVGSRNVRVLTSKWAVMAVISSNLLYNVHSL